MSQPKHANYQATCKQCGMLQHAGSLNQAVTTIEHHKAINKGHKCSYQPIKPPTQKGTQS